MPVLREIDQKLNCEKHILGRTDLCGMRRTLQEDEEGWSAPGMHPETLVEEVQLSFWMRRKNKLAFLSKTHLLWTTCFVVLHRCVCDLFRKVPKTSENVLNMLQPKTLNHFTVSVFNIVCLFQTNITQTAVFLCQIQSENNKIMIIKKYPMKENNCADWGTIWKSCG